MEQAELNRIGGIILDAAITVHKALGPGLLERAYVRALEVELQFRGLKTKREVMIRQCYRGVDLEEVYRMDLLVEDEIIIEAKARRELHPIDEAQIISHLKLAGKRLGYLINFHVLRLVDGFHRFVNGL
ncbi:MAG: GxxExxY protein [Chitinophagaceae bacterium]|nr:MAG: GxxExxY protein [Chitinophagaceae bacterium]